METEASRLTLAMAWVILLAIVAAVSLGVAYLVTASPNPGFWLTTVVVFVAGVPIGRSGSTNLMKLHRVAEPGILLGDLFAVEKRAESAALAILHRRLGCRPEQAHVAHELTNRRLFGGGERRQTAVLLLPVLHLERGYLGQISHLGDMVPVINER